MGFAGIQWDPIEHPEALRDASGTAATAFGEGAGIANCARQRPPDSNPGWHALLPAPPASAVSPFLPHGKILAHAAPPLHRTIVQGLGRETLAPSVTACRGRSPAPRRG